MNTTAASFARGRCGVTGSVRTLVVSPGAGLVISRWRATVWPGCTKEDMQVRGYTAALFTLFAGALTVLMGQFISSNGDRFSFGGGIYPVDGTTICWGGVLLVAGALLWARRCHQHYERRYNKRYRP